MWALLWVLMCVPWDGTLILKNGKKITYQGDYRIEEGYVVFEVRGKTYRLPEHQVDLEESQRRAAAAVAEAKAAAAREKQKRLQALPSERHNPSLAELVGREDEIPRAGGVTITTQTLEENYVPANRGYSRYQRWMRQQQRREVDPNYIAPEEKAMLLAVFDELRAQANIDKKELERRRRELQAEVRRLSSSLPVRGVLESDEDAHLRHQADLERAEADLALVERELRRIEKFLVELDREERKLRNR